MLDPSYAMYPIYARMFGATPVQIPFGADLSLDPDALLAAFDSDVELVFIANPNQPTGTVLADDVVRALLDRAEAVGALVIVDEAYYPFSEHTLLPWVADRPNLVVTRTFSKAWGLAGVRAGLVAADPEVVRNLYKVRSAYDVNAVAAACVGVMLDHAVGRRRLRARGGRRAGAARRPREALWGSNRFRAARTSRCSASTGRATPRSSSQTLHARGYIVKGPFGAPGLADCIRVTLGGAGADGAVRRRARRRSRSAAG